MSFSISSMLNPDVYDHPVRDIELIETHISWVILTGDYAYKIKKPINYGFLDFSTLQKRKQCCEQELRLNRRLAPGIYLGLVAICGIPAKPVLSEFGNSPDSSCNHNDIFEYAVKMMQFPQSAQLDNKLAAGELTGEHMDAIAQMVADFHSSIKVADSTTDYGSKDAIYRPIAENFRLIRETLRSHDRVLGTVLNGTLDRLNQWNKAEFTKLESTIQQRKKDGFVRECHGDMHLRNLVWLEDKTSVIGHGNIHGKPMAFDCIEFNPRLRWIDVMNEIAFLVMDLQDRKHKQLASRFLNSYLEVSGDYAGLSMLPFYLCYRAMVRAKVNVLRLQQEGIDPQERQQVLAEFESYIELATEYTSISKPVQKPKLIIMRGLSASGKSTVSQQLLDEIGAIRIRSDVERKRLFSAQTSKNTSSKIEQGLYSAQASQQTYAKLAELAIHIINAGYSVIVDAAFLKQEQRVPFQKLADNLEVPYLILEITAPTEILRQRIVARKNDVSDADLQVLEHQLSHWQPLQDEELRRSITVNTDTNTNSEQYLRLSALIDRINSSH